MARRSLSPMQRLRIFEMTSGQCHICGQRIQVGQAWEVEHKIPVALGGADDEFNLAPAHKSCHAPKTVEDVGRIAKAKRCAAKHNGIRKPSQWRTKWKRKVNGEVVPR